MKKINNIIWWLQVRLAYFVEGIAMYLVKLSYQIYNYKLPEEAKFYEWFVSDCFSQKLDSYLNDKYPNKKQEK